MSLKVNINKIHSDLLSKYDVKIQEKSSKEFGDYMELIVLEGNKTLHLNVSKRELEKNQFSWKYWSNPIKKDHLVERVSTIDSMLKDIDDIFTKNRFDSDYIKSF